MSLGHLWSITRLYDATYDLPAEPWFRSMLFRVRFFWKIQIRISESENEFCVFLGTSKHGSWIQKIHIQGGFFGSNPNPDFWDSQSERFLGKDLKKVFLTSGFSKKKNWYATDAVHLWLLTKPMLVRLINFEPLITYHSLFIIYSNYWCTVLKPLLVMFFVRM